MGLFKKLFATDPEALEKKGDALFEVGDFGPAKLTYEKALAARGEGEHPELAQKIRDCTDGIARHRIEEARSYLADGQIELAAMELEGALEVAVSDPVRQEAQELRRALNEARQALGRAQEELRQKELDLNSDRSRVKRLSAEVDNVQ